MAKNKHDKQDRDLNELFEDLKLLWPALRVYGGDMSTKEVIINPMPGDPEAVQLGLDGSVTFKGYVVNAQNPQANLKCSIFPILGNGSVDLQHPVYDSLPPAVSGDQWIISFILSPNANYGLYAVLNEQPGASSKLFFTTGN